MRSFFRRISARDEGFTLVELLMAMMIFSIVLGAMLTMFTGVERTAARQVSRSEVTDMMRVAIDRIAKDVRQAITIRAGSSASMLDMDTYVNGGEHRITYEVTGDLLTRTVDAGTAITVLKRVQTSSVFGYTQDVTDPSVISITLVAKPERFSGDLSAVTLTSEVQLRNR